MADKQVLIRKSDCGKIVTYVETDTSLAVYHDFVLKEKGWAVDKMVAIHMEQIKEAEQKILKEIKEYEAPMEALKQECDSDCTKE